MPTNEKRREIAARLRDWESFRETFGESPICAALDALNVEGYLDWRGVCELLADLIEPEPERTCTPVYRYFGETFPHSIHVTELSCGHEFRWYGHGHTPNYCPDCGAKVVSDE